MSGDVQLQQAQAAYVQGRKSLALMLFRQVLSRDPDNVAGLADLGGLYLEQGRSTEALPLLERALELDEDAPGARHNLAGAYQLEGRLEEAEEIYEGMLKEGKAGAGSLADFGRLLLLNRQPTRAREILLRALPDRPQDKDLVGDLAKACIMLGHWEEANDWFLKSILMDPDVEEHGWALAALDLLMGRFHEGWSRWECRWETRNRRTPLRPFTQPMWTGDPFRGRTLLLWAEQGLGDTLMLLRFLPEVRARGGKVVLEVQRALVPLVEANVEVDALVAAGQPLPAFDLHLPLMSLLRVLDVVPGPTLPPTPYLRVPDQVPRRAALDQQLGALPPGPRVGLVWAGSPNHQNDHLRSLPPERLAPLLELPGVTWVGLQAGVACPLPLSLDLGPQLEHFADTAHALMHVDLLLTVDTAMAHLAGALGRPVWLMVAFSPDWRWMFGRRDSPWYPSLRLFRQPFPGDWDTVIAHVRKELGRGTC